MTPLESFAALLHAADDMSLPLLRAAAEVPCYADPQCDAHGVLEQVRRWREQLAARISADASPRSRLRLLNHFFFEELGFAGDRDNYDCADNSYLHRVIERRRGLPITLALLYVEIGRATGLTLRGVSFPGHFLVRLQLGAQAAFIDVFGGGKSLSRQDLSARLEAYASRRAQGEIELAPYLRPASDREILARLLRNLKRLHGQLQQWPQALQIADRLVLVLPDAPEERLERSHLYERLECPRAAAEDLVAYLSMCAAPPDLPLLRDRLVRLQRAAARLN
jgi:regulator of sirC expression with transglutaminase-like and TPR domain